MHGRIWKVTLLLAAALSMGAAGHGSAMAPLEETTRTTVTTEAAPADADAEIEALLAELGGGSSPDSQACCQATCLLSSCRTCCDAPSLPSCSCTTLGEARCNCVAPPPAVQQLYQQIQEIIEGGGSG